MTKKTALLMQAALSEVASTLFLPLGKGGQVLFVLPKKLDDVPHVHGMPEPTEDLMKKIKFLYASPGTELRDYSVLSRFKIEIDGISSEMEDVMRSIFHVGDCAKR